MRKIDIFNHIWPRPFYEALSKVAAPMTDITRRVESVPMITDLDRRFEVMDMFGDYCQVLSLAAPPLEAVADPDQALELSRIGSDSMAQLCQKYPDRFPAFIATAPVSNPDKMIEETERAIGQLGARGVQVFSNVAGLPLDRAEFQPLFDYMAKVDLPVWMHPARGPDFPDYLSEDRSLYEIWWTFGWPYETSAAMARLVFSKTFDRLPDLRVITHHAGAMAPFFEGRIGPGWDQLGTRTSKVDYTPLLRELKQRPIDYFRLFYADTATFGSQKAIEHAIDFFGIDRVLFASDAPFDPEGGPYYIRETIKAIDRMGLSEEERRKVYEGNAVKLLRL